MAASVGAGGSGGRVAPLPEDSLVEIPLPRDKGKGRPADAADSPVQLAPGAGGLVPVGPGLVVSSSSDLAAALPPLGAAPTLCVFVVRFDTKHGNTLEWVHPEGADVAGAEFSCLPSGSHNIHEDVICFKNGLFYGVAAFGRAAGAVDMERGARLRAVGVLSPDYLGLAAHIPFLRSRVRHALRNPGDYSELVPYYEATRSPWDMPQHVRASADGGEAIGTPESAGDSPASASSSSGALQRVQRPTAAQILQEMPPGQLATFVDYFGPYIFLVGKALPPHRTRTDPTAPSRPQIWKNVLAQKRILFFAPPPVLSLTHHVLSALTLGAHHLESGPEVPTDPVFYVNLNDIIEVSHKPHYIGCTTDSIILSKPQYYDLFLDHGIPVSGGPPVGGLGSNVAPAPKFFVTELDKSRYRELRKIISEAAREAERPRVGAAAGAPSASDSGAFLLPDPSPASNADVASQTDSGFSEGRKDSGTSARAEEGTAEEEAERERMVAADRQLAQEMERTTDTRIAKYFATLNSRIFQHFLDVSKRPEPTVRPQDYAQMGLHPRYDQPFLCEIAELYGFDVNIEPPSAAPLGELAAIASRVRSGCVKGVALVATGCWRVGAGVVHGTKNAVNAVGACWGRNAEGDLRI
ncbi:hypothetical protein DFJ74DRAFT_642594 [Hyaloraphidium curvatum]|nr:hypothetical protein DFJ74DRAFT_642594 [Hyaloraphidium curvatum]